MLILFDIKSKKSITYVDIHLKISNQLNIQWEIEFYIRSFNYLFNNYKKSKQNSCEF
jgi:hypothetical protein